MSAEYARHPHADELPRRLTALGHEVTRYAHSTLERDLATDRPDVVHAHSWLSGLAALSAVQHTDIPVVQTCDGLDPAEHRLVKRVVGHTAARIVVACQDDAAELVSSGVRRSRISVVPAGVDTTVFNPEGPVAWRSERYRVIAADDGADLVGAAMSGVPSAELVVPGDRVTPELLRSADAVVCVPKRDSLGRLALAAMACGVPVVAQPVGALADVVVDGVTGVHVPTRQPRFLAQVLRNLLADPVRRCTLGVAGRDRVECRYSWDRVAAEMVRIYARSGAERAVPLPTGGDATDHSGQ
ncbi:Glycosyltransferase involved in cell wall bisynthesis [Allokutzneria albata]|uniref:Glycosyltransferase involved in cell wall bisynthesis n=1 Tax=Allokutzneria albata TaxID=211114 RepID=A0A1G9TRL6_ALLAB|nr:Glycosyltransferase involved in cell wall bisynthesis [Allokutzneria albata]